MPDQRNVRCAQRNGKDQDRREREQHKIPGRLQQDVENLVFRVNVRLPDDICRQDQEHDQYEDQEQRESRVEDRVVRIRIVAQLPEERADKEDKDEGNIAVEKYAHRNGVLPRSADKIHGGDDHGRHAGHDRDIPEIRFLIKRVEYHSLSPFLTDIIVKILSCRVRFLQCRQTLPRKGM